MEAVERIKKHSNRLVTTSTSKSTSIFADYDAKSPDFVGPSDSTCENSMSSDKATSSEENPISESVSEERAVVNVVQMSEPEEFPVFIIEDDLQNNKAAYNRTVSLTKVPDIKSSEHSHVNHLSHEALPKGQDDKETRYKVQNALEISQPVLTGSGKRKGRQQKKVQSNGADEIEKYPVYILEEHPLFYSEMSEADRNKAFTDPRDGDQNTKPSSPNIKEQSQTEPGSPKMMDRNSSSQQWTFHEQLVGGSEKPSDKFFPVGRHPRWSVDRMQLAVNAVRSKTLSHREASRMYGIPRSTLQRYTRGKGLRNAFFKSPDQTDLEERMYRAVNAVRAGQLSHREASKMFGIPRSTLQRYTKVKESQRGRAKEKLQMNKPQPDENKVMQCIAEKRFILPKVETVPHMQISEHISHELPNTSNKTSEQGISLSDKSHQGPDNVNSGSQQKISLSSTRQQDSYHADYKHDCPSSPAGCDCVECGSKEDQEYLQTIHKDPLKGSSHHHPYYPPLVYKFGASPLTSCGCINCLHQRTDAYPHTFTHDFAPLRPFHALSCECAACFDSHGIKARGVGTSSSSEMQHRKSSNTSTCHQQIINVQHVPVSYRAILPKDPNNHTGTQGDANPQAKILYRPILPLETEMLKQTKDDSVSVSKCPSATRKGFQSGEFRNDERNSDGIMQNLPPQAQSIDCSSQDTNSVPKRKRKIDRVIGTYKEDAADSFDKVCRAYWDVKNKKLSNREAAEKYGIARTTLQRYTSGERPLTALVDNGKRQQVLFKAYNEVLNGQLSMTDASKKYAVSYSALYNFARKRSQLAVPTHKESSSEAKNVKLFLHFEPTEKAEELEDNTAHLVKKEVSEEDDMPSLHGHECHFMSNKDKEAKNGSKLVKHSHSKLVQDQSEQKGNKDVKEEGKPRKSTQLAANSSPIVKKIIGGSSGRPARWTLEAMYLAHNDVIYNKLSHRQASMKYNVPRSTLQRYTSGQRSLIYIEDDETGDKKLVARPGKSERKSAKGTLGKKSSSDVSCPTQLTVKVKSNDESNAFSTKEEQAKTQLSQLHESICGETLSPQNCQEDSHASTYKGIHQGLPSQSHNELSRFDSQINSEHRIDNLHHDAYNFKDTNEKSESERCIISSESHSGMSREDASKEESVSKDTHIIFHEEKEPLRNCVAKDEEIVQYSSKTATNNSILYGSDDNDRSCMFRFETKSPGPYEVSKQALKPQTVKDDDGQVRSSPDSPDHDDLQSSPSPGFWLHMPSATKPREIKEGKEMEDLPSHSQRAECKTHQNEIHYEHSGVFVNRHNVVSPFESEDTRKRHHVQCPETPTETLCPSEPRRAAQESPSSSENEDSNDGTVNNLGRKRKWSVDSMLSACNDVKSGQLARHEAARMYGIPRSTLRECLVGERPLSAILKLTEKQCAAQEACLAVINDNLHMKEAAKKYDVPYSTVYRYVRKMKGKELKDDGKTLDSHDEFDMIHKEGEEEQSEDSTFNSADFKETKTNQLERDNISDDSFTNLGRSKSWSIQTISRAYDEVMNGTLSVRMAARKYGLPRSTLRKCILGERPLSSLEKLSEKKSAIEQAYDAMKTENLSITKASLLYEVPYTTFYRYCKKQKESGDLECIDFDEQDIKCDDESTGSPSKDEETVMHKQPNSSESNDEEIDILSNNNEDFQEDPLLMVTRKPCWSIESMVRAYSDVKNKRLSIRKASVKYGVPRSSLQWYTSGRRSFGRICKLYEREKAYEPDCNNGDGSSVSDSETNEHIGTRTNFNSSDSKDDRFVSKNKQDFEFGKKRGEAEHIDKGEKLYFGSDHPDIRNENSDVFEESQVDTRPTSPDIRSRFDGNLVNVKREQQEPVEDAEQKFHGMRLHFDEDHVNISNKEPDDPRDIPVYTGLYPKDVKLYFYADNTMTFEDAESIDNCSTSVAPSPRKYSSWCTENMKRAYRDVKDGWLSMRKASMKYNVPRTTLREFVLGHKYFNDETVMT